MKKSLFLCLAVSSCFLSAQEKPSPYTAVTAFFEAFHAKDSSALQQAFSHKARLLRSGNRNNIPKLSENNIHEFIQAVSTRKDSPVWEERLGEPIVQQHLNLATVWVPFRFYLDQNLSHCGYNAFTLHWIGDQWKILTLIDTATKDCEALSF